MSGSSDQPTLMLHGFLGSARSWDNAPLDTSQRIAPDLFGHGVLPPLASKTTFDAECRRLLRIAPEGCRLLGYSMGARVALGMLCLDPDHFSSVTLVSVNPGLQTQTERDARAELEAGWCAQIEEFGLESFVEDWERLALFSTQAHLDELVLERQRAIRTSHFGEGVISSIRSLGLSAMPNLWPLLSDIRVPLTLVCGAEDKKFVEIGRQVYQQVSTSRLVILDDCGHNPIIERPELFWATP